ncbi:ankyrin repeat domain-containing protein [Streptomyces sp. NPDC094438]|uniref:ankyrin repeat domain-containing protein n=1 Tax=Streptomyces sp. NPDC094438 TaxID=3366061 RepID=UPI003821C420
MVSSDRTRAIVTKLFADVAGGNVQGVLDAIAPDIVFDLPSNEFTSAIPNLGVWRGKEGVTEAFRLRGAFADVTEFEQREMIVEEDRAFVVNFQRIRHKATGFEVSFEFSMLLTVGDDDLIHHWKAFFDASAEVAMFRSDINERLLAAVQRKVTDEVRTLLLDGANPNHRDTATGLTVLQTAAGLGDAETVRALIAAGGDLYSTDSRAGGTALHKAVQNGDLATVRALVEAGAFVDAVAPTTGHTPLMDALWYKWPDIVGYLLDHHAGLNLTTHYGFSLREHFEYELNVNTLGKDKMLAAEQLLKQRTQDDDERRTRHRLIAATAEGDTSEVRGLIASGADIEERFPVVNGFNDAHTALLVAARDGHTEIVRALLAAGADVNATEPTFGAVPLHKAVYNGHADITRILVEAPGVDLDYQGATNGYTALHDALWHGYEECARVLIAAGARTDLAGHDGKTAHDIASDVFGADHALPRELARDN